MSAIEGGLREAYAKRFEQGVTTKASLAEKIGCDRSLITRRLNGGENMTVKTIADLAWALGHCIEVKITDAAEQSHRNGAIYDPDNVPAQPNPSVTQLSAGTWGTLAPALSVQAAQLSRAVS